MLWPPPKPPPTPFAVLMLTLAEAYAAGVCGAAPLIDDALRPKEEEATAGGVSGCGGTLWGVGIFREGGK